MSKMDRIAKQEFNSVIDKIVERKEYKQLRDSLRVTKSLEDLMNNIAEKIQAWIEEFMKNRLNMAETGEMPKVLSYIFLALAIIIFATILVMIIVNIRKAFEKKQKIKEILGEKITEKTTPYTLKKKAEEQEEQGNLRNAMRYHFIGVLLLMHDARLIYLEETKTNSEIYSFLKKQACPFLSLFHYSMDKFNYVWYGHKNFEKKSYIEWKENTDKLWNEVIYYETKGR